MDQDGGTGAAQRGRGDPAYHRTQYPTIPSRVDYALTDLGHRACALLEGVRQWAESNLADVLAARAAYDARTAEQPQRPSGDA